MIQFAIYKYLFNQSANRHLESQDVEIGSVLENAQKHFGSFLDKQLVIGKMRKGEWMRYPNPKFVNHDDITILKVQNVKNQTVTNDYTEHKVEDNPWCYVVIDNRPGIGQIAIEQSGAFDRNTDAVRDLLMATFNTLLAPYGIEIDIRAKMRTQEFWSLIEEQKRVMNDTIEKIVIDFPNPRSNGMLDASKSESEYLKELGDRLMLEDAVRGQFAMFASPSGDLDIAKKAKDMGHIVTMCGKNGYNIGVYFRQMGLYRAGDKLKAVYKADERLLEEFFQTQTSFNEEEETTYDLILWLNMVREMIKDYEDALPNGPKGKRGGKRCV